MSVNSRAGQGDCWTPNIPKNGKEFRASLAVKHAWNTGAYYETLKIPTAQRLHDLGIAVPEGWQGLRTWRGLAAGQLDTEVSQNVFKASHTWLEGGGVQDFIDWTHPHNAPVKEYLLRQVPPYPTPWRDLQLPVSQKLDYPHVVSLGAMERSAKIQQEGYLLRGAAVVGKQSNNTNNTQTGAQP